MQIDPEIPVGRWIEFPVGANRPPTSPRPRGPRPRLPPATCLPEYKLDNTWTFKINVNNVSNKYYADNLVSRAPCAGRGKVGAGDSSRDFLAIPAAFVRIGGDDCKSRNDVIGNTKHHAPYSPQVVTPEELTRIHAHIATAVLGPGRETVGHRRSRSQNNEQLSHESDAMRAIRAIVLDAAWTVTPRFSAALPRRVFPPRVNRYQGRIQPLRRARGQRDSLRTAYAGSECARIFLHIVSRRSFKATTAANW